MTRNVVAARTRLWVLLTTCAVVGASSATELANSIVEDVRANPSQAQQTNSSTLWRAQPSGPVGASGIEERRFELVLTGDAGVNRIAMHRFGKPGAHDARVMLYLPGTNMNGEAALADEQHNLWLYLAARGVTVYALDYRSHFVSPDATDFKPMAAWTTDVYVHDALRALMLAHEQQPQAKLYVAGFSRGATLAYGLSCTAPPGLIAGLVALDGGFKNASDPPSVAIAPFVHPTFYRTRLQQGDKANHDESYTAAHSRFMASGAFADDVGAGIGWQNRQALMRSAIAGNGKAQESLARVLVNAWGDGRLANPGSVSDLRVLAQLMLGYDRFYPRVQNLEGGAIAQTANAPETAVDDCWGQMRMPILFVESAKFGAVSGAVSYSARRSGSRDVTGIKLPGFGHLDVLVAEHAVDLVYAPTLQWLRTH